MNFEVLAFWIMGFIAVASALMVVSARNPVHAVLFLILTFFTAAGLFVLIGAEFLAMLLIVVYVGAVAVLFLFVVMMLDVDFASMRQGFLNYLPLGGLVAFILLGELALTGASWVFSRSAEMARAHPVPDQISNIEAIGRVLYTDYVFFFQIAGLILLTAMIGAIVLTLHHKPHVKRQDPGRQAERSPEECIELVDIEPGRGL